MRSEREVSKAIRRLNADLGVEAANRKGLWLALGLVLGLIALASPFVLDVAAPEASYGKVVDVRYAHGKGGSPRALVEVGGRRIAVVISRGEACRTGDRIELVRHHVLLGERYTTGYRQCSRP